LMVGWFALTAGGWRLALASFALVPLLLRLGFGKVVPPPDLPRPQKISSGAAPDSQPLPFLYWVYWVALVLAVSVEFCMVFWSADYLEKALGMPKAAAAQAVSLFLVGMILGRLAGSRLVQQFSTARVVNAAILLASAGFLIFWTAGSLLLSELGLFLTGLGVASLYPLILSLAIGAAGKATVQASARATLASGTAILSLPLVLGRLADAFGIHPAYSVVILLVFGMFLIVQFTGKLTPARQPAA
jgi:fucose permease